MVTVTTKTINYTITRGNRTNSVNATITSTPGLNMNALKKPSGLVKILELVVMIAALVLLCVAIASGQTTNSKYDLILKAEVFLFSILIMGITTLLIHFIVYLVSTTSWILITRTTNMEVVYSAVMAILLLASGITEIVLSAIEMDNNETASADSMDLRVAAGVLGAFAGILYLISIVLAKMDLRGTSRGSTPQN